MVTLVWLIYFSNVHLFKPPIYIWGLTHTLYYFYNKKIHKVINVHQVKTSNVKTQD